MTAGCWKLTVGGVVAAHLLLLLYVYSDYRPADAAMLRALLWRVMRLAGL